MKRFICLLLSIVLAFGLVGCSREEKSEATTKLYYISTDKTEIVSVPYEFESVTASSKVREALDKLSTEVGEVDYMMTIPYGVSITEWDINEGNLAIFFSSEYLDLDPKTEVLVRAAIVQTLVQIKEVSSVSFYVDNAPLTNSTGMVVGAMTADTFIDDFGEETDSLLETKLILYFASADGMSVVAETRDVYYSRNVALEKLVVEQLLKGPNTEGLISSIPSDTKLISVSVTDGVCYVNFDAAFETVITGVTENATIYSIVNSLTRLDSVNSVQLVVNGEVPHLSNIEVDLSNPIERNDDIINTNIKANSTNDTKHENVDLGDIDVEDEDGNIVEEGDND